MKKTDARIVAANAEPMTGSPSHSYGGIDVGALYIDMLCERFRDRGIKKGTLDPARRAELEKNARMLGIVGNEVSAKDDKYKTMKIDGKAYMSCDDFAAYYKDLRGYRLPSFYTRAENEYEEALAAAKNVQESGKPPKKALWLAVKKRAKDKSVGFVNEFFVDEYKAHAREEVLDGEKKAMPRGVLTSIVVLTLSLMLIVCSSVMVSRASSTVSSLECEISELEEVRNGLLTDLEVKNDMLGIKEIAVKEYGMISGDYAASRYLDITEGEKIEVFETNKTGESPLSRLLRAIGLKND